MPGDSLVTIILGCFMFFAAIAYLGTHAVLLSRRIMRALHGLFGYSEAPSTVDVTLNQMYRERASERALGSEYRKAGHAIKEGEHARTHPRP